MVPYISSLEDVEYLSCEDELTDLQGNVSKKYFQENGSKMFWLVKGYAAAHRLNKQRLFSHSALCTCLKQPSAPF